MDEEEIEGNSEEEEAKGEIRYSDEEEGSYHTCVGEEDNRSSSGHEIKPTENVNVSPSQEDQLAQILANMTEYARPHSPLNLNIDINQLPENFVVDREITEKNLNEIVNPSEARVASSERYEQEEENIESIPQLGTPQVITESVEKMSSDESIQEHESMEEEPQEEEQGEDFAEGTAQNPVEQTGLDEQAIVPLRKKKKTTEVEKIRKERIKLHKLIEQLRQTIRVLRMK